MVWFKVDDKLHDHRKARKAGKSAMGVWVLAGSWSMDNETDGFIPDEVLSRWGTPADARRLVSAGLWDAGIHNEEPGWWFHDWSVFQPSAAVTAAKRAKEHEAGLLGNHKRWHAKRKISDPDCEFCFSPNLTEPLSATDEVAHSSAVRGDVDPSGGDPKGGGLGPVERGIHRVPDRVPDPHPDRVNIGGGESGANRPVPVPVPHYSVGDGKPSAQTLVGEWIKACETRPPGRVVGQVAKELGTMLGEDIPYDTVRAGLIAWHEKNLSPATLASVVHETQRKTLRVAGADPNAWMRRTL